MSRLVNRVKKLFNEEEGPSLIDYGIVISVIAAVRVSNRVKRFFGKEEEGASMVEYGIMVSLIAATCVAIVTTLGTKVKTAFTTVSASL